MKIFRGTKLVGTMDDKTTAIATHDALLMAAYKEARSTGFPVRVPVNSGPNVIADGLKRVKLTAGGDPEMLVQFADFLRMRDFSAKIDWDKL